jgi:hypothetical protein
VYHKESRDSGFDACYRYKRASLEKRGVGRLMSWCQSRALVYPTQCVKTNLRAERGGRREGGGGRGRREEGGGRRGVDINPKLEGRGGEGSRRKY